MLNNLKNLLALYICFFQGLMLDVVAYTLMSAWWLIKSKIISIFKKKYVDKIKTF